MTRDAATITDSRAIPRRWLGQAQHADVRAGDRAPGWTLRERSIGAGPSSDDGGARRWRWALERRSSMAAAVDAAVTAATLDVDAKGAFAARSMRLARRACSVASPSSPLLDGSEHVSTGALDARALGRDRKLADAMRSSAPRPRRRELAGAACGSSSRDVWSGPQAPSPTSCKAIRASRRAHRRGGDIANETLARAIAPEFLEAQRRLTRSSTECRLRSARSRKPARCTTSRRDRGRRDLHDRPELRREVDEAHTR